MAGKKKKKGGASDGGGGPPAEPTSEPARTPGPSAAAPRPAEGAGGAAAEPPPSRRRFLALAGGAVALGAAGVWYARQRSSGHDHVDHPHDAGAPDAGAASGPVPRPAQLVSFDEHEYDTLDALAGVLLPADEQDPGARETGAMVYIDRAMANPAFAVGKRGLKVAVKALDWQSQQAYAKTFAELGVPEQEAVVDAVYQGEADRGRFKGRTFLPMMMSLVLEGHLSEPVYGGNRDGQGWKLVAFEPVDPRPGHPGGGHHHGAGATPTPARARPARP